MNPEDLTKAMYMMAGETAKELGPALQKVMANILEKDMLPKDAIGMDPRTLEATYAQAYHHYNSGQYPEAARLFQLLQLADGTEPKFGLGLAASLQMLEEYQNALIIYGLVELVDPENPIPHYHASDCYDKMQLTAAGIAELEIAIELCGTQPQYTLLKERAQLTIKSLQDKIAPKSMEGNGEKK